MSDQIHAPRLHLGTKMGWGFADAGINVFVFLKSVVILAFMTQYMGVSAQTAGWITGLVVLTDMVTDPLVGAWSDRTNTRFGRRRPFMIVGMVLMFILTYLMFTPPAGMTGMAAGLWVFFFYALASIGFTMVAVPFGAMATEMTPSAQERTTLTGFRMASASIGLLLAGLFATPGAIAGGSMITWIIVGVLMMFPVTICVFATRNAPRPEGVQKVPMGQQFQILRSNPAFFRHVISYGIMTLGVAIISGGILFITSDIGIRKAANGSFDTYFATELDLDANPEMAERLGLSEPEGGWVNLSGVVATPEQVQQIDPRQPGWVEAIDYKALNDSPYGRRQVAGINQALKGAILNETSGLPKILVGLAGFFSAVFAMFLLGSILSQLIWVPLAGRIGRDRALVIALVIYGVSLIAYWQILQGGNLNLIIYGAMLLGACNGGYQNLPWAILPTMIDKANSDSEVNVEGVFNGFWLSGQKIANSLGPLLFAQLIGLYGYVESTVGFQLQPEGASSALEMFMTVLPGVFFLIAIPLFLTIPTALRR